MTPSVTAWLILWRGSVDHCNPSKEIVMDKLIPTDFHARSLVSESTLATLSEAKKGASRLLGCYRTGDANDPEVYISGVVAVLSRYTIEIIRAVTEPATGLPSKSNWLPTIAEIRKECDLLEERETRKAHLAKQLEEQFASREKPVETKPRPTYEELQRRCHDVGLMFGPKGSRLPPLDVAAFRQNHGISQEQWDAIPNAKRSANG